ncbi:MAG: metallophosphoesterase [Nitrospirae bacterium]|nr:metallophosphoesterase [Nitrospirota bacterium]
MPDNKIRLLHISDIHLQHPAALNPIPRWVSEPYNRETLYALTELAYELRQSYDVILLSGDIAHTASIKNLVFASRFVDSPVNDKSSNKWLNYHKEPTLSACGKQIIIVPGNHDRFKGLSCQPGGTEFEEVFYHYWYKYNNDVQEYFIPSKEEPQLAVICVDFSLKSIYDCQRFIEGSLWGQGKVYDDKLKFLKNKTDEIRSINHCDILWMLHFAPEFPNIKNDMELIDSHKLIKAATELKVKYIFCGHTHKTSSYLAQDIQIRCNGTSACLSKDYDTTVYLHEISISVRKVKQIRSLKYTYDNIKSKKFEPTKPQSVPVSAL